MGHMNPLLRDFALFVLIPFLAAMAAVAIFRACWRARSGYREDRIACEEDDWYDEYMLPAESEHDYYGDM